MGMSTRESKSPLSPPPAESHPPTPESAHISAPEARLRAAVREIGGPGGPEPTRYGDWERRGRCIDF